MQDEKLKELRCPRVRRGDMGFVNFLDSWIYSKTANDWLEQRRTYWFKTTDWSKNL